MIIIILKKRLKWNKLKCYFCYRVTLEIWKLIYSQASSKTKSNYERVSLNTKFKVEIKSMLFVPTINHATLYLWMAWSVWQMYDNHYCYYFLYSVSWVNWTPSWNLRSSPCWPYPSSTKLPPKWWAWHVQSINEVQRSKYHPPPIIIIIIINLSTT